MHGAEGKLAGLDFAQAKKKFPAAFKSGKVQEIKFRNLDGYLFCGSAERFFPEEKIAELAKDAEADALLTFHRFIRKRSLLPVLKMKLSGRTALFQWQQGKRVFVNYYVSRANVRVKVKHWFGKPSWRWFERRGIFPTGRR